MTQALLHCQQDIAVAAGLDMGHAVRMKTGKMKRGCKKVAPAQTPEHRAIDARKNAGEENGGARIIGKIGAAGDFMQRAGGNAAAGKPAVEFVYAERNCRMARGAALDLDDARTEIFKDGGLRHDIRKPGTKDSFYLCSISGMLVKLVESEFEMG